jgi:hypothetical protein
VKTAVATALAMLLACGEASKNAEVDQSKVGPECFIVNGSSNCADGEQCVTFPNLKAPHCTKDPCGAVICHGGSFCVLTVSLPGSVGCF